MRRNLRPLMAKRRKDSDGDGMVYSTNPGFSLADVLRDAMGDEELAGLDANPRPDSESEREQWRVVQRGTARKHAERFGSMLAAKRAKSNACG